jgi:D-glycero-alpha-D-manno-heptose-7-phosphate kinase
MIFKKKLVITKTPLRISFFGGGTDMPYFYKNNKGMTISTSINKFVYVTLKTHENFSEKFRLNYSDTEIVNNISKIKNLRIKETLKYFNINQPLYINTISDLPYNTGLGSSSAFLVGLIKGLFEMQGKTVSKIKAAEIAFKIENKITNNALGKQDHYIASFGGFKKIIYQKSIITVHSINIEKKNLNLLKKNLLFFWTGRERLSNSNLIEQKNSFLKNYTNLLNLNSFTSIFNQEIKNKKINIYKIGELLNKSWDLKKTFSPGISNNFLNQIYDIALVSGCVGGKLLGAGGGGFFLFICPDNKRIKVIKKLKDCVNIDFNFEKLGSTILVSI